MPIRWESVDLATLPKWAADEVAAGRPVWIRRSASASTDPGVRRFARRMMNGHIYRVRAADGTAITQITSYPDGEPNFMWKRVLDAAVKVPEGL